MKAKDTVAWTKQYPLTNAHKVAERAAQLQAYHNAKKGK